MCGRIWVVIANHVQPRERLCGHLQKSVDFALGLERALSVCVSVCVCVCVYDGDAHTHSLFPKSPYHPKGGLIGVYIYIYI